MRTTIQRLWNRIAGYRWRRLILPLWATVLCALLVAGAAPVAVDYLEHFKTPPRYEEAEIDAPEEEVPPDAEPGDPQPPGVRKSWIRDAPQPPVAASTRERAREEYVKGLRLFATSHNSEAISAFKGAIRIDPRYPDAHRALGSIYVRLGNLKGMCREFKTYVRLAPHASDTTKIKGEMAKYATTVPVCRTAAKAVSEAQAE